MGTCNFFIKFFIIKFLKFFLNFSKVFRGGLLIGVDIRCRSSSSRPPNCTFASLCSFFTFPAHDALASLAFALSVHEPVISPPCHHSNHLVITQRSLSAYSQHIANTQHTRRSRSHASLLFTFLLITRV